MQQASAEKYTDPKDPARSITDLTNHLTHQHSPNYVYRGQVKEYNSPLVPSVYRRLIIPDILFDRTSSEFQYRMRGIGNLFVSTVLNPSYLPSGPSKEIEAAAMVARLLGHETGYRVSGAKELQLLDRLVADYDLASHLCTTHFEDIIRSGLYENLVDELPGQLVNEAERIDYYSKYLDLNHRIFIRNEAFLAAFGYGLGTGIAQQYGFTSEGLDATTDIDVAAFFATHQAPLYSFVNQADSEQQQQQLGVIYRFEAPPAGDGKRQSHAYYSSPGTIFICDELKTFEWTGCTTLESFRSLKQHCDVLSAVGLTDKRSIKLPAGIVSESRIGRQAAALLVPDELRVTAPAPIKPQVPLGLLEVPVGKAVPVFSAVEDFRFRKGTTRYYFIHEKGPARAEFSPTDFWPNDQDFLLRLVCYLLLGRFVFRDESPYVVPPRLDLIDPGVGRIDAERTRRELADVAVRVDTAEAILETAASLGPSEGLRYTVYLAGMLCHQGYVEGELWRLNVALELRKKAQEARFVEPHMVGSKVEWHEVGPDYGNSVLALLEHVIYVTVGDRGERYLDSWARGLQGVDNDLESVKPMFRWIYDNVGRSWFPERFISLYESGVVPW